MGSRTRLEVAASADGLFDWSDAIILAETPKTDRLILIVGETQQIPNRRISPLNSRTQISDGSGRRFFAACAEKICAAESTHYHGAKQSSGNEDARAGVFTSRNVLVTFWGVIAYASNPADQPEIPVGLFFAIFPDPPAAALIARVARHLRRGYRLRGVLHLTNRFHSTLYKFRGDEGPAPLLVEKAKVAAANVVVPPFRVAFNRAGSFANKKDDYPFVLTGEDGVVGLLMLYRSLCMELRRAGLRPRASSNFTPHVTMFYDRRRIDEQTIEPIYWTVRKFILVLSLIGRTKYVSLGEWPLRG